MNDDHAEIEHDKDTDLLARTRAGDQRAYAELWRRYSQIARGVARTYWWSADSDDLVAESFTRIYQAIQAGKGPTSAFKPYLFATMRNLAISWGRSRREIPIEHIESVEDPRSTNAAADADFDASLVSTAILALPERWQEVLWFAEVENLSMREIGKRLDLTERAVAVLAFRAREGLRQAWIAAHLTSIPPASKDCRWTLGKLGAHARRRLTDRDSGRVHAHLEHCTECRARADEARQASSRMLSVLFPGGVVVGVGIQAWDSLTSSGVSANAAPMPVAVTLPVAGHATATATLTTLVAATFATLAVGVVASAVSISAAAFPDPASETESSLVAAVRPSGSASPSALPAPRPEPTAVVSAPVPPPDGSSGADDPQASVPPVSVPPPSRSVPPAPVIIDIPAQISRTQWISAAVRCEIGADITVSVYDFTLAAGVCTSDSQWQASFDVSSFPVPSGTAINVTFAQSNVAGTSGTASAEVVIVD